MDHGSVRVVRGELHVGDEPGQRSKILNLRVGG